jgi:hypothetical protein
MTDMQKTEIRPIEEERIREAVRIAVRSCRECDAGTDCTGPLMDLFKYLPEDVRAIVEDEQARALGDMVGGD